MIKNIYVLRDKLTGYLAPMVDDNDNIAKRNVAHALQLDSTLTVHSKLTDFSLCRIGEYNTDTGVIIPISPEVVCEITELVVKE